MTRFAMRCRRSRQHAAASMSILAVVLAAAWGCSSVSREQIGCAEQAAQPVSTVDLPGRPFQAIPTPDGCHVFVSLAGPVEPGDPRRPPEPGAPAGGVAVVGRRGGTPRLAHVMQLEGSPYGMTLTHDGRLLIVASDDKVAFIDTKRLLAGSVDAVLGYLSDAPMAGRIYANVSFDDRWLFLSDESARSISVVDLQKARATAFHPDSVVGQIPVGRAPIALTFSADHQRLYTTSQVTPETYGWPPVCHPPASDAVRQPPDYPEGAILVIDVVRATHDPANAVLGAVAAGCNPVRLVTSPGGDIAYVSARTDNALLVFDTGKLQSDPAHARIGRVPVGDAPVGIAVLNAGARLAVTNSNRFGSATTNQSLTIIDATQIVSGDAAVIGSVPAGVFPRELTLSADKKTLFLTNFGSKNLAVIDVARLPVETRKK